MNDNRSCFIRKELSFINIVLNLKCFVINISACNNEVVLVTRSEVVSQLITDLVHLINQIIFVFLLGILEILVDLVIASRDVGDGFICDALSSSADLSDLDLEHAPFLATGLGRIFHDFFQHFLLNYRIG